MASVDFTTGTVITAEWLNDVDAHTFDEAGAKHTADKITVTPAGSIAATDVQAALEELDTEKSATTHDHSGVYEPADATILKDADIGVTVQGYDANTLKASSIGVTVQGYDANTAKLNVDQAWTGSQRGTPTTDNDLSFDLTAANNFTCTPTGAGTLTFTNMASATGQSGFIKLVNGSDYAIALHANTKGSFSLATTISASGTYILSYYCDGTDVYVVSSAAMV